jgi:HEPN domain-containing protein
MYNPICVHATQAVEKLLKSYIVNNGRTIEKTHNLDYLHEAATKIDTCFDKENRSRYTVNRACHSSRLPEKALVVPGTV